MECMKRIEVIAAIEKLKKKPENRKWSAEFIEKLSQYTEQRRSQRSALGDDLHRAVVYCFMLSTRIGYVNKETRRFLRPTKRSVGFAFGFVLFVLIEIAFLVHILGLLSFGVYVIPSIVFILLFQLGYVGSLVSKLSLPRLRDENGVCLSCVDCSYSLAGLESVLGDRLWVGPAVCPECGQDYPAIPE